MRLTLHATRPTPHGTWRLVYVYFVQAMSAWSVKTRHDMLRPGIVGMRGSLVTQLRPCMTEYTPPPPPPPALHKLRPDFNGAHLHHPWGSRLRSRRVD